MKPFYIATVCLFSLCGLLVAQTIPLGSGVIPFLDASQTNIDVKFYDIDSSKPCPPEYTNSVGNTNLFTLPEQNLIKLIPTKYKNIATNSWPEGSCLISFSSTNGAWTAKLAYANSSAKEEITYGTNLLVAKFRYPPGEGYDVTFCNYKRGTSEFELEQIKGNLSDGLYGAINKNHCNGMMHFKDGLAVGKWFIWSLEGELILQAEFKTPYDYKKHLLPMRMSEN